MNDSFAFAVIQNEAKRNEESLKINLRFFELRSHPFRLCQNDTLCVNFTLYIN